MRKLSSGLGRERTRCRCRWIPGYEREEVFVTDNTAERRTRSSGKIAHGVFRKRRMSNKSEVIEWTDDSPFAYDYEH